MDAPGPQQSIGTATDRPRRIMLALLTAAYTLNFVDRTIVASIGQAIKADLKISDTQLGLLGGLYFALLYTVLGLPLARFAERRSRVNIISGAVLLWSGLTALCGAASSYGWLALFRFGVGVGEAGLSPPAHSLISDYHDEGRRASALSIYSLGVPIGVMIGAVVGGFLAQRFSWRVAFVAAGAPGLGLALAIKLLVREPERRKPPGTTLSAELRATLAVAGKLLGDRAARHMVIGITLASFAGYGGGQFVQPYWARVFGLSYTEIGLIVGLIGGVGQMAGVLLGGFICDRLARSGARAWYGLVPAIGLASSYPLVLAVYTAASWQAAAAWLLFPGALAYVYMGPTYGVVQNAVVPEQRATATAVLFFILNLIALGLGPPFAGWLIDRLAAFHLIFPNRPGVLPAIGHLLATDASMFQRACPGGVGAVPGSAVDTTCRAALQLATRQGVLLAYAVGLWDALHYLLAAWAMRRGRGR